MTPVEESFLTAEHDKVAIWRDRVNSAYFNWLEEMREACVERRTQAQPWHRRMTFWENILRGAASTITLFPDTFNASENHAFNLPLRPNESSDAWIEDWYSIGNDLYTVLRSGPAELTESVADDRPLQHEFNWAGPTR